MKYLNDVKAKDIKSSIGTDTVYQSKNSGCFTITSYLDSYNIGVKFVNTGFEMATLLGHIKSGSIKDPYSPSVCGVGVLGTKYLSTINGVHTKEYMLWRYMLRRCYSDIFKKKQPTYEGCEVSENFKYYEYFYEWCHKQIGFDNDGNGNPFQLDKDLLMKGNKVYSEPTCIFIPSEINLVLVKCTASRGKHLIGVYWSKTAKAFIARVNKNKGKSEHLGLFKTEIEAFDAYKTAKEAFVKEQANKWKGKIDERAYNALMKYEVGIDD